MAMPSSWAAWPIWLLMVSTMVLSAPCGSIKHEKRNAGSTPKVEMSFALTLTASQPMRSTAPVIGSMETMSDFSPRSITVPSTPVVGPRVISLRWAPRFLKTTSFSTSTGIFPGGNIAGPQV